MRDLVAMYVYDALTGGVLDHNAPVGATTQVMPSVLVPPRGQATHGLPSVETVLAAHTVHTPPTSSVPAAHTATTYSS